MKTHNYKYLTAVLLSFGLNLCGFAQGDIKFSLVKWSFRMETDLLCKEAKGMGIDALDKTDSLKWNVTIANGLKVAVADGADLGIERGFCNNEWHQKLIDNYRKIIPVLQQKGIKQIICYSGINTTNLSDEEALNICANGLKPILEIAEKSGVILTMELLSSNKYKDAFAKQRFGHYQCDNVEWGVALCRKLNSPNFRLLYNVWHMHDMGRDVYPDIQKFNQYFSHYTIAGIPHRGTLRESDPFDYSRFINELIKCNYNGYVGLEPDRIEKNINGSIKQSLNILKSTIKP